MSKLKLRQETGFTYKKAADDGAAVQLQPPAVTWRAEFVPFAEKMRKAGQPEAAIHAFHHYYTQLVEGATGFIGGEAAQPVTNLPAYEELISYTEQGVQALDRTVMIKLNGGLGTTMGLTGPKSLVEVKEGLSFLDIIVRQVLHLRERYAVQLPLVLMNSFNTDRATHDALAAYPALAAQPVPLTFQQHQIPKIWTHDLGPAVWPDALEKEWCPPGHGDIYLALQTSGLLAALLEQGYEYAFVSNVDNLGATVDLAILGYFAATQQSFLMEVAKREPADRKGGHLAQNAEQGLILREVAQCPPEELASFQDIARYQYFNTNNLWVHLPTLQQLLLAQGGFLALPLIRNEKAIDPTQPETGRVYQLETAMGQAIALFPAAQAVQIPRRRFLPVKSTNDLLALWSDAYVLEADYTIGLNPARTVQHDLLIDLDKNYYGLFHQLKEHFLHGVPSLVDCEELHVEGNIYFDSALGLKGKVWLHNQKEKPLHFAVPRTRKETA